MSKPLIRVLLVEDDEDDFIITQEYLAEIQQADYQLDWVSTYQEALEKMIKCQHDVFLVDYRLGPHNGLELAQKALESGCTQPFILMTGQGGFEIDLRAMESGVEDYLVKGKIDSQVLERSIRYAIERNRKETQLRKSEHRYRSLFESAQDIILIFDNERTLIDANTAGADKLGYSDSEALKGIQAKDIFVDREEETQFFNTLNCDGVLRSTEYKMVRADDTVLHTLGSATLHRDDDGKVVRIESIFSDFTERIQFEIILRESAERNQAFIQKSPLIIYQYDFYPPMPIDLPINDQVDWILEKSSLVDANEAHERWADTSLDELTGLRILDGFGGNDEVARPIIQDFIENGYLLENAEYYVPNYSGKFSWVLENVTGLLENGELKRIMGTIVDLTDRKLSEERVRESEINLKKAQEVAKLGSWVYDTTTEQFEFSDGMTTVIGFPKAGEELTFETICSLVHKDDRELFLSVVNTARESMVSDSHIFRFHNLIEDRYIHLKLETEAEEKPGSEDVLLFGTVQDVTDEILSSAALFASENRYRTLFEHSGDGISIHNGPYYINVNSAWSEMFGLTEEETIGKTPFDFSPFQQPDGQISEEKGVDFLEQVNAGEELTFEWRHTRSDGTDFDVEVVMTGINLEGKIVHISFLRDITERKRFEESLQRRVDELNILQEVSAICLENVDEDLTIGAITCLIGDSLYPDHFGIMLLDVEQEVLRIHPSYQGLAEQDLTLEIPLGVGITGQVAKENKSRRVDDASNTKDYIAPIITQQSELCVPISINGTVYGVINAESVQIGAFSEEDERLLETVADQLALALQKSRLFTEEKRRRIEAEANREASAALTGSLDLTEVLDNILQNLRKVVKSDQASIHLFENNHVKIVAGNGFANPEEVIGITYPFENKLAKAVYDSRKTLVLEDALEDPRFENIGMVNTRGWIGAPLIEQNNVIGYMTIDSKHRGAFTKEDANRVQVFANNAAGAIVKARLFEEEKKRRLEAEIQQEISVSLANSLELDQVLNTALNNLQRYLDYDSSGIFLQENGHMRIVAVNGFENADKIHNQLVPEDHPLFQEIKETRSVLLIDDVEGDDRFEDFGANYQIRGWMGVPLIDQGKVFGYYSFDSTTPGKFTPEMGQLAQVLVNQTAVAIVKAKLFEDTQQSMKRLETLHEIDQIITSSVDLSFAIKQIMQIVVTQLGIDAAALVLYDTNNQTFTPINSIGFKSKSFDTHPLYGNGFATRVALKRSMLVIDDPAELKDHHKFDQLTNVEGFQQYVGVPLIAKGETKGVLELFHRSKLEFRKEWKDFLQALTTQLAIAIDNSQMYENLQRSNLELILSYDATIEGWAKTLELRDQETQGHSERVTAMTVKLARAMGMSEEDLIHIRRGALLHDVGKIGIPDSILQKPGELDPDERKVMEEHPALAHKVLSGSVFLQKALDIPYCHHEKWDGSGYPRQLIGNAIPLAARIFAIIDVYDALRSDRPYRDAWSKEKSLDYIKDQSGSHFDPQVVEKFLQLAEDDWDFNVYDKEVNPSDR